jgi:cysteine desulfurase/selenocysteine lyase
MKACAIVCTTNPAVVDAVSGALDRCGPRLLVCRSSLGVLGAAQGVDADLLILDLEAMPPYQGGGDMIRSVTFEKTTYNELPDKFEAGTPNIAGVIGLGAAIDYVDAIGFGNIAAHEEDLLACATEALFQIPGLRLICTARDKTGVLSYVLKDVHPHDVGTVLDREGIAIRTGHHCAQPVMQRFGVPATARPPGLLQHGKTSTP